MFVFLFIDRDCAHPALPEQELESAPKCMDRIYARLRPQPEPVDRSVGFHPAPRSFAAASNTAFAASAAVLNRPRLRSSWSNASWPARPRPKMKPIASRPSVTYISSDLLVGLIATTPTRAG